MSNQAHVAWRERERNPGCNYTVDTLVIRTDSDYRGLKSVRQSAYVGIYENIGLRWLVSYPGCCMSCDSTIDENGHYQAIYQ